MRAKPRMLGFVVPNTLLVDRRYRSQRRAVEQLYGEVELVSLPDGVFNVSQLDTALLIARDLRQPGASQRVRSSAVYDADKKRFAVDRIPSHISEETRRFRRQRMEPSGRLRCSMCGARLVICRPLVPLCTDIGAFGGMANSRSRREYSTLRDPIAFPALWTAARSINSFLDRTVISTHRAELSVGGGILGTRPRSWQMPGD